jgi:outer membrane receptor protein involved in Fe transport
MLRLGGSIEARPVKKLFVNATIDFWDGIYAREVDGAALKLPAFLDIGLSGEYKIIPRLSVFLQLSNILNNKYQRWNQYDSYGFNIIGGLRFMF